MSELDRLRWQLNVSWSLLSLHLEQVTDEEALWEPVSNCWNVRRKTDGTWAADWAVPEPEPIPVPTIGWVMWHIGLWWSTAYKQCFEHSDAATAEFDWSEAASMTPWPGDVKSATIWLNECRDQWADALKSLSRAELDSTTRSGWFAGITHPGTCARLGERRAYEERLGDRIAASSARCGSGLTRRASHFLKFSADHARIWIYGSSSLPW